ncbi:Uncharacterised protein [Yersinia pseudotuberculosis]|uniref:Uncharacterized protein n=1 Tax=Yersinia pseudotuberculosis TaxID=633 RepID=A0A380Q4J0_YERPU|nr:Uncharacterised protein [Yersinia pseudotuberculosis]
MNIFAPPRFLSGTAGAYQLTSWVWANVVYLPINNEGYLLTYLFINVRIY